jgi:hypothetical protein
MGAADRLEDGFPHGTVNGYRGGCRDANCPAPLPCRDVYRRYSGDYSFKRLVDAGVPLEEILRRDEEDRAGAEQRDKAAARAARKGTPAPRPKAPAKPKAERPAAAARKPAPAPVPAVDPLEAWQQAREAWRAQRKDLYAVLRGAERAVEAAIADRDRAQAAFDEFVAAAEPQKPEQPKRRHRQRAEVEAGVRRLNAEGMTDAEVAAELGITRAYAGIVRRDLQLPAIVKRSAPRAPREPRAPRQVLGHGTNASYARGCRCDDCRRAQREYHRAWMASRRTNAEEIPAEHHGTAYGYQLGCRSRKLCPSTPSCADASLAEERRRRREAGIPEIAPRVDAERVRMHVRALMAAGMTMDAIAAGADVHRSRIGDLIYGRSDPGRKGELAQQIEAEKATRILALEVTA